MVPVRDRVSKVLETVYVIGDRIDHAIDFEVRPYSFTVFDEPKKKR